MMFESTVAILVPALARPWNVAPLLASIEAATPEPHWVAFIIDSDDIAEREALIAARADAIVVAPGATYAEKINGGFAFTCAPWIFQGADDLRFYPGWLPAALAAAGDRYGVVGTNDLYNPRVLAGQASTHSLIRRAYIAEQGGTVDGSGLVLSEAYRHVFVDDELVQTARSRGQFIHAHDSIVEHLHPYAQKSEMDSTYEKGMSVIAEDQATFESRTHLWGGVNGALPPGMRPAPVRPPLRRAPR